MRRRIGVVAAALVLAAGLGVPAASAQAHMLVGLQDDAMTVYGNPSTTFNTSSFGSITGTTTDNRDIQFGLKLSF